MLHGLFVYFTSSCSTASCTRAQVFVNSEDIDFGGAADMEPTQEFPLVPNVEGAGFSPVRQGAFRSVTAIAFYIT